MSAHLLDAAKLIDLGGSDPGLEAGIDAGHTSTSRAEVAQEANDVNYLAYLRKPVAAVFVELVNGLRVRQGKPNAVITPRLGHGSTIAGRLWAGAELQSDVVELARRGYRVLRLA
jgi:hypothetical protein